MLAPRAALLHAALRAARVGGHQRGKEVQHIHAAHAQGSAHRFGHGQARIGGRDGRAGRRRMNAVGIEAAAARPAIVAVGQDACGRGRIAAAQGVGCAEGLVAAPKDQRIGILCPRAVVDANKAVGQIGGIGGQSADAGGVGLTEGGQALVGQIEAAAASQREIVGHGAADRHQHAFKAFALHHRQRQGQCLEHPAGPFRWQARSRR